MSTDQFEQLRANAEAGKPDAQFLLSQICLQNRDIPGMLRWVRQASANGFPDAHGALGQCYETGQGVARDLDVAMEHYERAVQAGSSIAAFHKAQLLYKSRQGPEKGQLIYELLSSAAAAGIVPALRTLGYMAMQHESSKALALDCLRRAALRGDPVSSFNLGWCLVEGWRGEGVNSEAAHFLQQAARADYPFAEEMLRSLPDAQAVSTPDMPDDKIQFCEALAMYPETQDVEKQIVSTDPPITLFKDVLNIVDCAYLIFLSRPYMKRASVIDPEGGKDGMVSDVRTSMSTYLPFEIVDIIGRYVELKIICETGEDLLSSEPMSILRYAPGEYYRPHVDYFEPKLAVSQEFIQDGGQRTASAVTYLIAPTAGGSTSFPNLKLTVPPTTGGTLWFRNCLEDGQVDERSLHAGDIVEEGEKWVVTKWFREKPTQYIQI